MLLHAQSAGPARDSDRSPAPTWLDAPDPSAVVDPAFVFDAVEAASSREAPDPREAPVSLALEMRGYGRSYNDAGPSTSFTDALRPVAPAAARARRSPFLAALFSAIIPGTGELYAGSYVLAGVFAALEGAGWYFMSEQNRRGDEKTVEFEAYANRHWNVVKYAEWLNANAKNFPGGDKAVTIDIDPDVSRPPWERVNWEQMHTTEMAIPQFSHRLPPYGDQQYYELIGKYNQYSYGWDDKQDGDYWNPSDRFLFYSGLRGDANSHYDTADMIVNLVILNHVLSAVDAAWAAARFNEHVELHSGAGLQRLPDGRADLTATATFTLRF